MLKKTLLTLLILGSFNIIASELSINYNHCPILKQEARSLKSQVMISRKMGLITESEARLFKFAINGAGKTKAHTLNEGCLIIEDNMNQVKEAMESLSCD